MSTKPKVALITGGARRIGAAIARYLHQHNWQVIIHCNHSITQAEELVSELNKIRSNSASVFVFDLLDSHKLHRAVKTELENIGRLDALINNASYFCKSNLEEADIEQWHKLFDVNVLAPFLISLAAKPYLAKTQGCIVNITDAHIEHPLRDYAVYSQTKAALTMQTKAVAKEFAPNIRVNAVAPGAIAWPEGDNMLTLEQQAKILKQIPLEQTGEPMHIAQAVLALIENTFITGETLCVDGGRS